MDFTFGILTKYDNETQLREVIDSIHALNIPNYQVLIIGEQKREGAEKERYIWFEDSVKPGWITRKKNLLARAANYQNIVLMHDYFVFDKDWYNNFLEFGNNWDICSCSQYLINGKRHFTDWVTWDSPIFPRYTSLNYDDWSHVHYMYQSGGFTVAKTQLIIDNPFNEELGWGQSDDVEWSLRVRHRYKYVCNGKSIVRHNKAHRDAK
jgi:hypothetical protein